MRHLGDGALRRMIDEPLAATEADRRHLADCAQCGARRDRISTEAEAAGSLLAVGSFEPDARAALTMVKNRVEVAPAPRRTWARWSWTASRSARPLVLAAALVVIGGLAIGASPSVLTIFNPTAGVKTVTVSNPNVDVAGLPDLSSYGTVNVVKKGTTQAVLSAAEAQAATGLTPPAVPAGYEGKTVTYTTIGQSVVSFTFDAAKAKAAAIAAGKPAPVFPPGVDGTTLTITAGPAIGVVYGTIDKNTSLSNLPLVEGVATPPVVTSSGVSAAELESFLIQQPGIADNPTLVADIKAIGQPLASGSLVIPIPAGMATSTPETVHGQSGVLIADNTGSVKGLIWEENGLVHAVGGHFDEGQLLALAG